MRDDEHIMSFDFDAFRVDLRGNFGAGNCMLEYYFKGSKSTAYAPTESLMVSWVYFIPGFVAYSLHVTFLGDKETATFASFGGNEELFFRKIGAYLGLREFLPVQPVYEVPHVVKTKEKTKETYFQKLRHHPGLSVATMITMLAFFAGASNKSGPWYIGGPIAMVVVGAIAWGAVLISNFKR